MPSHQRASGPSAGNGDGEAPPPMIGVSAEVSGSRAAPVRGADPPGLAGVELDAPPGAWNLADDEPCSQNAVIEHACRLLGLAPPPLQSLDEAGLSPMARAFYAENRRVANGKAKRLLGWTLRYPTFREGLAEIAAYSFSVTPAKAGVQLDDGGEKAGSPPSRG